MKRDDSAEPAALFARCCALLRHGDPEAVSLLPRLDSFPMFAPGWEQLGATLQACGRAEAASVAYARAASAFAQAEAHMPADASLAFRRGQCLRRAGRTAEAVQALERSVALDPKAADGWFALGLARQDQGAPAAEAFAEALRCRPQWHEAALNLGVARQEVGALDAALDAYAVAWRTRPETLARIAQALVSGRAGRLYLSLDVLRSVLARRAGPLGAE